MFIEKAFTKDNYFWKYIAGSLIVITASVFGQIPLTVAVFIKLFEEKQDFKTMKSEQFMQVLDKNLGFFLLLLSFLVGLIALFFVIKKLHQHTILQVTTSRKSIDWKRVFFSFSVWALFSAATVYGSFLFMPEDFVWNFEARPFFIMAIIAILFIPIQTSLEEYIFRGYLMQGFGLLSKNRWFPLVLTSVIFGSMHLLNPEVTKLGYIMLVYYIGTGLLLGIMTLMDEGMELALGFHAANNLVGCLLVTSDWSALQTNSLLRDISEPNAGLSVLAPVLIIYPLLLLLFAIKYKWNNWQEKLTGTIE